MLRTTVTLLAVLAFCRGAAAASHPDDVAALTALRGALDDKDGFFGSPGVFGWQNSDPCPGAASGADKLWTGVDCDYSVEPARVTTLNTAVLGPGTFKSTLPADLQKLSALTALHLEGSGFHGTLPAAWGASGFQELKELYLGHNQVSGSLPGDWGSRTRFQKLVSLTAYSNKFTGSLPASWGSEGAFPQLLTMSLGDNDISGSLPASWASGFPSITDLNLDSLHLSGSLPQSLTLDKLQTLHVQNNNLTGKLPENYPLEMPHLADLNVQGNQLQGAVPATWQNWGSLKTVSLLLGNSLCGRLEASFVQSKDGQRVQDAEASESGSVELPACQGVPGVAHSSPLASAAATWWLWALAILLAGVAIVGLAKRRTVYVLLKGDSAEEGQRHLAAKGKSKGSGSHSKIAEMI